MKTRHGKTLEEIRLAIIVAKEKVATLREKGADYKEIDAANLELIQLWHDEQWLESKMYLNKRRASRIGRGRR